MQPLPVYMLSHWFLSTYSTIKWCVVISWHTNNSSGWQRACDCNLNMADSNVPPYPALNSLWHGGQWNAIIQLFTTLRADLSCVCVCVFERRLNKKLKAGLRSCGRQSQWRRKDKTLKADRETDDGIKGIENMTNNELLTMIGSMVPFILSDAVWCWPISDRSVCVNVFVVLN